MIPRSQRGALAVGLAVTTIGLAVLAITLQVPTSPMYSRVGPTAFPYGIGTMLSLLGLLLMLDARRGSWICEATTASEAKPDWKAIAIIVAGFVAAMILVATAGFIIAATALFTAATIAFGLRSPLKSAVIGFVIAFIAYFTFAKLLGLRMGTGIIERFL